MFRKLTLSVILAAVLATTISTAFAAPKADRHNNTTVPITRTVPMTGAEWWQNYSNADSMGEVYRPRR